MRGVRGMLGGMALCAVLAGCSTEPATNITETTATLNGKGITGAAPVAYWFEYAPADIALGGSSPEIARTPVRGPATATALTAFSEDVDDLDVGRGYHYRACGRAEGRDDAVCTAERAFTTDSPYAQVCGPEGCRVGAATAVTATSATLHATGGPRRAALDFWFRYRADAAGEPRQTPVRTVPAGDEILDYAEPVDGLEPLTSYTVELCVRRHDTPGAAATCTTPGSVRTTYVTPDFVAHGGMVWLVGTGHNLLDGLATAGAFDVHATAGPGGAGPDGPALAGIGLDRPGPSLFSLDGTVTCVNVTSATTAIVNARDASDGVVWTFFVTDGGSDGDDVVRAWPYARNPEDCSPRRDDEFGTVLIMDAGSGSIVVEPGPG